ncbi:MAG: hypothetical protein JSV34_01645 [Candidatus Omnitrophota bacterium]|nr:MAG: hypothetical protein JSV34_01645 [Candidatus Omnitrophota bacterium]
MRKILVTITISILSFLLITNCRPATQINIEQLKSGGYTLYVNDKPFFVKGVIYNPTPIGSGYDYDFYSDPNKPWMDDGKLMKELGINCIRVYSAGKDLEKVKEFIADMYQNFGIYTIMSDWLGLWSYPAANYADAEFQKKIEEEVLKIVHALKDEEGLLMWILGNENNYTFSGEIGFWTSPEIEKETEPFKKINKKAEIYYSFVNRLTAKIKKIDKTHPVALGNGEANFLNIASGVCKNIDVLAIIIYRGKTFGNLFDNIRRTFDKPIFLSEFGCDSYDAYKEEENQAVQAEFLLSQWREVYNNCPLSGNQKGNCIGGVTFEWNDEWWKHNQGYRRDWSIHNTEGGWSQGAYFFDNRVKNNLNMNEEWFGIVSLNEDLENNINKRIPKESFSILKDFFAALGKKKGQQKNTQLTGK